MRKIILIALIIIISMVTLVYGEKTGVLNEILKPEGIEVSGAARTLGRANRFYGITNNKFYYLKENEDEDVWELHVTEMK